MILPQILPSGHFFKAICNVETELLFFFLIELLLIVHDIVCNILAMNFFYSVTLKSIGFSCASMSLILS